MIENISLALGLQACIGIRFLLHKAIRDASSSHKQSITTSS